MKTFGFFILVFTAQCMAYTKEMNVYQLEGEAISEFQYEFRDQLRIFCFYSPYAVDTKEFLPKYKNAAATLKLNEAPITLAMIDISRPGNKDFSLKHDVLGYPAVVYYLSGLTEPRLYLGKKETNAMISEFQEMVFDFHDFSTEEEFNSYMTTHRQVQGLVLGVFQDYSGKSYDLFYDFAQKNSDAYKFGRVKGEKWAEKFGLEKEGVAVIRPTLLLTSYDTPFKSASKFSSKSDFENFIKTEIHPNISWVTQRNKDEFFNGPTPLVALYFNADPKMYSSQIKYYINRYADAVNQYFSTNKFKFVIVDRESFIEKLEADFLNTDKIVLVLYREEKKYVLRQSQLLTNDNKFLGPAIKEFLEGWEKGKVKKYVRSQPVPSKKIENRVRVVVGDTFEDEVQNSNKNQLVYIYSTSNPKSVEVIKTIEEVAEYFKQEPQFEIVKIDGSLNELPFMFDVSYYPTMYFSPKKRKDIPVRYSGYDYSKQKIIEFINPEEKKKKKEDL
ncbi:unnamed protein product [Blepharisma stoltei]|uniref:protein disulfide-isomerase n=1 Tax=Blepharisma stoltei TaxID=1481888 RepID=A0AAU9IGY0_9CILI|nr:unnamed protein product [Blepharisma stoltei]